MRSARTSLAALGLGGALALGLAAPAFSQATSSTTPPAAAAKGQRGDRRQLTDAERAAKDAEHKANQTARLTELATRLGVSVDKLKAALADQAKADVDKAVAAGRLTAAQATEIKTRIDAGDTGPGFGGRGGRGGHGPGDGGPGRDGTPAAKTTAA